MKNISEKLKIVMSVWLICLLIPTDNVAQDKKYNVAIFLYNDVELLDFAGPAEVFASADFNTYSVTVDGNPIKCNRTGSILNDITPDYSMENAPAPDVVVFPGGGTSQVSQNEEVLKWVKNLASKGTFLMSVCTGASVLANTGLLSGKNITTWYGFIPRLQGSHPELNVLEKTRFVDNGIYLTTAGVSAGIDGALHLVSRISGIDEAKDAAKYMEYDKWNPEDGRVDVKNEFLEQLRSQNISSEKALAVLPEGASIPYVGEFKNLASEYVKVGNLMEAARILEVCVKLHPSATTAYAMLAKTYKSLGKPAPEDEEYYLELFMSSKFEEALARYESDSWKFPGWVKIPHGGKMTSWGVTEFGRRNYEGALKAFQFVALSSPEYGSYYNVGETQMTMGRKAEAIASYRKCLEFVPGDQEVSKILKELLASNK